MASSRSRYHGDLETVIAVIEPHAKRKTWLEYAEHENVGKGPKADVETILKHKGLIGELKELQDNLSFKQSDFTSVFRVIADKKRMNGS